MCSFSTKLVLEECARDLCLVLHYKQLKPRLMRQLRPWALCHSGGGTSYDEYDVLRDRNYREIVHNFDGAQIGFCGGHQILASFFGSRIAPMRKLRRGEPDLSSYSPGDFKEWGVYPVRILRPDPIFRGFRSVIRVQEYHAWEVKRLGAELKLLAASPGCRVQAFVHRHKPVYGAQFHPESAPKGYPDGRKILGNFFRLARACGLKN